MASSPSSLPPWAKRREDPNPPDGWQEMPLVAASDIRFSNVDKKSYVSEKPVRLCNYMDVYNKEYVRGNEDFMHATASEGEIARFAVQSGDVIITKDEIEGLMADLLYVDSPPTGTTVLTQWVKEHADTLGRKYTSELARRKDRTTAYRSN